MKKTNPLLVDKLELSGLKVLVGGHYRYFTSLFVFQVDYSSYDYYTENEDNVGFRLCRTTWKNK